MLKITKSKSKYSDAIHEQVLLIQPTEKEIETISVKYSVPQSFLKTALQMNALPSVKLRGDALMMVIQTPVATEKRRGIPYDSVAIGIYLAPTYTVTICAASHPVLPMITTFSHQYALQLLELTAISTIDALEEIDARINATEDKLKTAIHNKQMFKLMDYNRSLTILSRASKANQVMVHKLVNELHTWLEKEEDVQLLDIEMELNQAVDMAQVYNINLGSLMDAYSATIENNLSISVQRLTIYVLIAAIPLGLASMFGMNTPLPLQYEPYILAVIAITAVAVVTATILTLRKRQMI